MSEYVCKHCRDIYLVYGTSLRCDICNRKLKLTEDSEIAKLEAKWDMEKEKA